MAKRLANARRTTKAAGADDGRAAAACAVQAACKGTGHGHGQVRAGGPAQRGRAGYTAVYLALEPLEQAVLVRLIEQGTAFRPFDAPSMAFYAQQLGAKVGTKVGTKVGPSAVQKALDALREHSEQLVWKSQRGQYAVYDQGLLAWHAFLVAGMAWPPKG